jgi:peroxiredoxin Q/BCP
MLLKLGQDAPDFTVKASDGRSLSLAEFRGKKNVVLYFYPRDFTSICTTESCGFRDMYEEVSGRDTEIIGVSLDTDESHRKFAARHALQFPLVADTDKTLTRKYGAIGTIRSLLGTAKRITFVIDKHGKIAGVFEGELSSKPHLRGVKEVLERLEPKQPGQKTA